MAAAQTLVTGGTGFLGRHVIATLLDNGHEPGQVRVLARGADASLAARGVEMVQGSIVRSRDVAEAMAGVEVVYHLAGKVDRSPEALGELMAVHVDGTRNIVKAAAEAGVRRVVYVSTSGTLGVSKSPNHIANEDDPTPLELVRHWPYYLSKVYAEQTATDHAADLEVELVTVNPTLLLGPGDERSSSTEDVLKFLRRQIPSIPSGGMSFVDVRDVAQATVAAAERGRPGKRYLMTAANWTVGKFLRHLESISGVKAPIMKVPDGAARLAAQVLEWGYKAVGRAAPLDRITVEMSQHYWYVDASRAQEELGFSPRDPDETLQDTVDDVRRRYGLD